MRFRLLKLPSTSQRRELTDKIAYFLLSLIIHLIAFNYWGVLPSRGVAHAKPDGHYVDKTGMSLQVRMLPAPLVASSESPGEIKAALLPPPTIAIPYGSDPISANDKDDVRLSQDPTPPWCNELGISPERIIENTRDPEPEFGPNPGYIVLIVTIGKDGTVGQVITKDASMREGLQKQAIMIVTKAHFKPGLLNGAPTACRKEYIIAPPANP
jgi:hypothetical protein